MQRRRRANALRVALHRWNPVRRGIANCVLAFPSPPNQVDRRVTRPRETRTRSYAPAAAKSFKMPNKMLIDATHPEETRVVVVRGNRVEEFDFETAQRKQLRGNIYLAKVTRVEPSLQAAFIEYGGNRHGFLAFSEIHPDYYQIPVADRQALIEADERAHREAEEESENRSNRHRGRSRHRNSRRRGHGDRVRSEIVENAGPDAALLEPQEGQPSHGEQPDYETHAHEAQGEHHGEHHEHEAHDHDHHHDHEGDHHHDHEHAHDEHAHASDETAAPAAQPDPVVAAVEESVATTAPEAPAPVEVNHDGERAAEEQAHENIAH